jgi:tetratricopeptide (TPR) repeat protein
MTAVSLTGYWLWRCGVLKKIASVPFGPVLLPIQFVTTILGRSTGALLLLAGGMFMLWTSSRFKTRAILVALLLFGPFYVFVRTRNLWSGKQAVALVKSYLGEERAISLETRLIAEELYSAKAMQQPYFGWGGWDRGTVYYDADSPEPKHMVPTDGLWIVVITSKGLFGLCLLYLSLELPVMLFLYRVPARYWTHPQIAPAALAAALLCIYMLDCLLNGFVNIIYVTLAGGLVGIDPGLARKAAAPRRAVGAAGRSSALALEAAPAVSRAGAQEIELADEYIRRGRSAKDSARFDEARVSWQYGLDILTGIAARSPGNPDARRRWCDCANDLAWLLLCHADSAARNPARALALATQVVRECPGQAVYWNTLGVAYFRSGNFQAAVPALQRAIDLDASGSPFDHVYLAMAHARLGHRELARHCLSQALTGMERDYPGHPELARVCDEAQSIVSAASESTAGAL